MSGKEAVAFILDASPTMNNPYPCTSKTETRLSSSKTALEGMLCELILQSKSNEAGVVILKTKITDHHLSPKEVGDSPVKSSLFPNVTQLGIVGGEPISRPSVDLLRKVRSVEAYIPDEGEIVRGDFCDGIIIAADALHRRTAGRAYRRKLVLFTDACHEVKVEEQVLRVITDGMKQLECKLVVIGLDFAHECEFDDPVPADCDDEFDPRGTQKESYSDDEDSNASIVKRENEKFLISLARLTGGSVIAASTMNHIIQSTHGKRIPVSTLKKIMLHIAPDLIVEARLSLLTSKANVPSLKREAIMMDQNDKLMFNSLGEEMTSPIITHTPYVEPDDKEEIGVEKAFTTKAFKYGGCLFPIGDDGLEGLKIRSPVSLTILGYAPVLPNFPRSKFIGQPYIVSGGKSRRSSVAISALAQGLHDLDQGAFCSLVKSKDADPLIGALLPLVQSPNIAPNFLFFVQMPFKDDVVKTTMPPLESVGEDECRVCDNLIDSLMLPNDTLNSHNIPNPSIRSFNQLVMHRAINPTSSDAKIPTNSAIGQNGAEFNPMATPTSVLIQSEKAIQCFKSAFPLLDKIKEKKFSSNKSRFWSP